MAGTFGSPFFSLHRFWCGTGSPGTRLRECPPAACGRLLLYFAASSTRHSRPASEVVRTESQWNAHSTSGVRSVRCLTQRNKGGGLGAAQAGGHSRSRIPDDPGTRTCAGTKKGSQRLPPRPSPDADKVVRPSPAPAHPWPCWKSGCGSCCAPCAHRPHLRSALHAWPATSAVPPPACLPSRPVPDR